MPAARTAEGGASPPGQASQVTAPPRPARHAPPRRRPPRRLRKANWQHSAPPPSFAGQGTKTQPPEGRRTRPTVRALQAPQTAGGTRRPESQAAVLRGSGQGGWQGRGMGAHPREATPGAPEPRSGCACIAHRSEVMCTQAAGLAGPQPTKQLPLWAMPATAGHASSPCGLHVRMWAPQSMNAAPGPPTQPTPDERCRPAPPGRKAAVAGAPSRWMHICCTRLAPQLMPPASVATAPSSGSPRCSSWGRRPRSKQHSSTKVRADCAAKLAQSTCALLTTPLQRCRRRAARWRAGRGGGCGRSPAPHSWAALQPDAEPRGNQLCACSKGRSLTTAE